MEHILVIEDDANIRNLIEVTLDGFNYKVTYFENAEDALAFLDKNKVDLIIFDWMLPGMDGLSAIQYLRKQKEYQDLPMIMLTAKDKEIDKITGLDYGADDYLTKPFSVLELAARIRSLLRRTHKVVQHEFVIGDMVVNMDVRKVSIQQAPIELTYKEFELLKYLLENQQRVVSRNEIFQTLWGFDFVGESRTLDVHINSLRKKLGSPYDDMIKVVRGVGYRFVME